MLPTTELEALYASRRYLIMIASATAWGFNVLFALVMWPQLNALERGGVILASLLVVLGYIWNKRTWALWCFSIGLLLFAFTALAAPSDGRAWLAVGPLISDAMYFSITLVPVVGGLMCIPIGVASVLLIAKSGASSVVGAGLTYAGGWFAAVQFTLGGAFLWWAWRSLSLEALRSDDEARQLEEQANRLLQLTERAAQWRVTAARIHESVLNSIRYVLKTSEIDRDRLRNEVLRDAQHFFATQPIEPTVEEQESARVVRQRDEVEGTVPFNKARLLVSAPLSGQVLGGSLYAVMLFTAARGAGQVAAVMSVVAVVITMVIVVRRNRVRGWRSAVAILVPAIVPWVLLMNPLDCSQAAVVSAVVNLTGFAVMIIAAWTSFRAGAAGLIVWGSGTILLSFGTGTGCGSSLYVTLLNSLVALPIILSVSYAGARAFSAAQERSARIRQVEIAEHSRSRASIDLNQHLKSIVDLAMKDLNAIAQGAELDDERRAALEAVDSRIRAAIQVDPQSDGAFAVWAQALVEEAAAVGVRVDVSGLGSSSRQAQLPIQVQRLVYSVLVDRGAGVPRLRAFTDDVVDVLSVAVDRGAIARAGLRVPSTLRFEDVMIELEPDDADRVLCVVSRPVQGPALVNS